MDAREPSWTKRISSNSVCFFFYLMFLLVALGAGLVVLVDLTAILGGRKGSIMYLFRSLLTLSIPLLNALFMYILCSRSLLEKS
jgi:hypothetical protein